jgi:hypothetical protein
MRHHLFLPILCLSASLLRCSTMADACTDTVTRRTAAHALVSEAQSALDQATVLVALIEDADTRGEAEDALHEARTQLRLSARVLADVDSVCDTFDPHATFSDFARAWRRLSTYVVPGMDPPRVVEP